MKEKKKWLEIAEEYLCIIVGTVCMAIAVNVIFEPIGMVTGGVSGLAIVIEELTEHSKIGAIPIWCSNLLINIPIFLAGLHVKGRRYIGKTLIANLCFTAALYLIPQAEVAQKDYLLAAVVGSLFNGVGLGLVFMRGYSTGGTDLLSTIIHRYLPYYPVGWILFILDTFVILTGAFLFGVNVAVYAAISVYVSARIIDAIVEGGKFAKLAYIISDEYEYIGQEIMRSMQRGVTVLDSTGMYTKKKRKTLLCVVGKKEIVTLSQLVRKCDKKAFVIISDVREVLGEGFVKNGQS